MCIGVLCKRSVHGQIMRKKQTRQEQKQLQSIKQVYIGVTDRGMVARRSHARHAHAASLSR